MPYPLSPEAEQEIVKAIRTAEKNTSGEIRVHIEKDGTETPFEQAQKVFCALGMHQTQNRNAVLFYVAYETHHFVILGDEGINMKVPVDFWNQTKDLVLSYFAQNDLKNGLIQGILKAGQQLKMFFPYDERTDIDELPNEISRG